jgi:hypothetical protein
LRGHPELDEPWVQRALPNTLSSPTPTTCEGWVDDNREDTIGLTSIFTVVPSQAVLGLTLESFHGLIQCDNLCRHRFVLAA